MQSPWRDARVEPLDGRTGREKIIRRMIFNCACQVVGSGVQRSDRPCWGIQGGKAPLASLAKAEKPKGFFGAAVRCGLPQCETCLITHRRFRSLGGRRRVICGLAICPGGRCLMPVKRARISVPEGNDIRLDDPANEEGAKQSGELFAPSQ